MTPATPEELMYEIVRCNEEINRVASRLTGISYGVFEPVSLAMPKFAPAELGFLRLVSWLFVLYYEVGKVGVAFLGERLATYGLDPDGHLHTHRQLVQQLRTFLQHHLDPRKPHDRGIQGNCEQWLQEHCGTPVPGTDEQWKTCLLALLSEAHRFLEVLLQTIRNIEQDESREEICHAWLFRIQRYHPPHVFDELIAVVAVDMGRENLDPVRLRTRFYDKWTQELALLQTDYDFEVEARKLIEYALLTAMARALPITGKDIMEEFTIPPGSRIGELLERARRLYEAEPCSRPILLERLRQEGL